MSKYKLELIVFLSGATVMVLELTGSRVLAPYLGTSLFIWTSLIGIILGSLSLGYHMGGKLADKNPDYNKFSNIIFISAIFIGLTAIIKEPVLTALQDTIKDLRIGSVLAATTLFAPASIFLGMISPYAVRLKMKNVEHSGRTVGTLYAISTIGSIAGTFLAGFLLIALLGNTSLLYLLAITQIILSIIASHRKVLTPKIAVIGIFIGFLLLSKQAQAQSNILEIDTAYNNVRIFDDIDNRSDKPVRRLSTNTDSSSAMFLDSDDLVYIYTAFYDLAEHFFPDFQKTLMIGGGAYSYPKYFLQRYQQATIDVVEIDPGLTDLSRKYFRLKDDPRLTIFHEDGRTFLNRNTEKYDVIYMDAFKSYYSLPHQLTTIEAVEKMHAALTDEGVVLANIISPIEGPRAGFLQAEVKTFKEIFPQVFIIPVQYPGDGVSLQNNILVALKSSEAPATNSEDPILNGFLNQLWKNEISTDLPILTDDFAPVDQYIMKLL